MSLNQKLVISSNIKIDEMFGKTSTKQKVIFYC